MHDFSFLFKRNGKFKEINLSRSGKQIFHCNNILPKYANLNILILNNFCRIHINRNYCCFLRIFIWMKIIGILEKEKTREIVLAIHLSAYFTTYTMHRMLILLKFKSAFTYNYYKFGTEVNFKKLRIRWNTEIMC